MELKGQTLIGWVKTLENEVLEMDNFSEELNFWYWFDFVEFIKKDLEFYGKNQILNDGLTYDWETGRCLDWSSIEIELFLKPIGLSYWNKILSTYRIIFYSQYPGSFESKLYQICKPDDSNSKKLTLTFSKFEGKTSFQVKFI